jgi:hypothetical protein
LCVRIFACLSDDDCVSGFLLVCPMMIVCPDFCLFVRIFACLSDDDCVSGFLLVCPMMIVCPDFCLPFFGVWALTWCFICLTFVILAKNIPIKSSIYSLLIYGYIFSGLPLQIQ